MEVIEEVAEIESRLEAAAVPRARFLARAGIDPSTWTRWRAGTSVPRLDRWRAAKAAAAFLWERPARDPDPAAPVAAAPAAPRFDHTAAPPFPPARDGETVPQ